MLVSLRHRFVFFCMPKCASNSIEAALKPHCEIHLLGSPQIRHTNVRMWQTYVRPYLDAALVGDLELVTVCREPVSWLNSWYRFRARHALREQEHPNSTAQVSFLDFVRAYLSDQPPLFADVSSQFEFVATHEGNVGVDRLFRYEELPELVEYFSDRIGQRLVLKASNVSPRRVYSSDLLERADSFRRRALSIFGRSEQTHAAANNSPSLPVELMDALRARIPRDFLLHEKLC